MDIQDIRTFLYAGKSTFTLLNTKTGNRYTYKVNKLSEKDMWFVSVLSGPDNTNDYQYMGMLLNNSPIRTTKGSKVFDTATSFKVFRWFMQYILEKNELPSHIEFVRSGNCGRCGRKLTTPKSVDDGFGPECISRI